MTIAVMMQADMNKMRSIYSMFEDLCAAKLHILFQKSTKMRVKKS